MSDAIQVEPEHYQWLEYNTRRRWSSYWHQMRDVLTIGAKSCLVIGPGDGTVAEALRRVGVAVTTMDIDDRLQPDAVGDIRAIPFGDDNFDVTLCAQVLEHIPFEDIGGALAEMSRVTKTAVVLSIPQRGRAFEFALRLPPFKRVAVGRVMPARTDQVFDGQHYWELGARNYRRPRVEKALQEHFAIDGSYVVSDNPYHRFYRLRPRSGR